MRRLHHLGIAAQELAHEAKLLAFNPPDWLVHPLGRHFPVRNRLVFCLASRVIGVA
jgi:predicted Rossmann fold nucleotide-binding protein DprA/Smf involved in DNA uptake